MEFKSLNIIKEINECDNDAPLIHCITNPISINDCANAVLAVGAKPIMAEHPKEVAEITRTAKALAVNLGNITDARMESIRISGEVARDMHIHSIIDIAGVACSKLRLEYAQDYIRDIKPSVIKGNLSEIKALMNIKTDAQGVDASENDKVNEQNIVQIAKMLSSYSVMSGAVILASGKTDLIAENDNVYAINNGTEMLGKITGTGCILNVLVASYLSNNSPLSSAIYATALLGVCGEKAYTTKGAGTFHINLMNQLSILRKSDVIDGVKITKIM